MTFTGNLKKLRTEHKYRQSEVADGIGISRPRYANYETGRIPELEIVIKIADFYGIALDELVGREPQGRSVTSQISTEEDKKLLWQSYIRSRKTDDLIMFMLFLLKITCSDKIKAVAEKTIQGIAKYVIKNAYFYMKSEIMAHNDDALNLYFEMSEDAKQLSVEVHDRFCELKDDIDFGTFSREELLNPETINRYFHIPSIEQILSGDPGRFEAPESINQDEPMISESGSVGV